MLLIGFFLIFFGAMKSADKTNTKVAVGGFIGFIPFGFANDKQMMWVLIGIMAFFVILWILFNGR